jgi:UDPglucose 6-dehydrogenase
LYWGGYVGGPTMAVLADRCPHLRVTVTDINSERINSWNSEELPIYEPGLEAVIARTRGRNLFFTTDASTAIRLADIIFVSVNTPTKMFGEGAGRAANLQFWEKTAREILAHSGSEICPQYVGEHVQHDRGQAYRGFWVRVQG